MKSRQEILLGCTVEEYGDILILTKPDGTIINTKVPKTGDRIAALALYLRPNLHYNKELSTLYNAVVLTDLQYVYICGVNVRILKERDES